MSTVTDNETTRRFELDEDGHTSFATYRRADNIVTIPHVESPLELRGKRHRRPPDGRHSGARPREWLQNSADLPLRGGVVPAASRSGGRINLTRELSCPCAAQRLQSAPYPGEQSRVPSSEGKNQSESAASQALAGWRSRCFALFAFTFQSFVAQVHYPRRAAGSASTSLDAGKRLAARQASGERRSVELSDLSGGSARGPIHNAICGHVRASVLRDLLYCQLQRCGDDGSGRITQLEKPRATAHLTSDP